MYYISKIGWKKYTLTKALQHFGIFDTHSRNCWKVNKDVLDWLDENHSKKFFMFVHYFDIHRDTFGGKKRLKEKIEHYDENVKMVDEALKKIIDKLKKHDVFKKTLIVLMADHGDTLNKNKKLGHGLNLNENELNIPLIMYRPDILSPKKINFLTRTIDIMPTVLEFLKIPSYFKMDGVSLVDTILNEKEIVKEVFVETYPGFSNVKGIRTKEWLYILKNNKDEELYNIIDDPQLEKNVVNENKETALKSKVRVKKHFSLKYEEQEVDEYTHQMLKKLGYA